MQVVTTVQHKEQQFYDSIYVISHSQKSVSTYKTGINHLKKFLELEYGFDEIRLVEKIKNEEIDVYEFLRLIIIYLDKKEIKPKGMRSYLSGINGYLRFLGVKINSDDYKLLVKIPKIVKTREVALTKEVIAQLLRNATPKLATGILVTIASGIRIGELVQLKLADIDFESNPTKISIRGNTSKGRFSRETFLTTEATNALKDYLGHYFGWVDGSKNEHLLETYIFWRISRPKSTTKIPKFNPEHAKSSFYTSLSRQIDKIPELNKKNENGRNAIHFHAFRKFFRTNVGNVCGRDFAEALMGHSFYMDTYYQLPEEKKLEMYLDAESQLTILDSKAVETSLNNLSKKYQNLESKMDGIMSYLKSNSIPIPNF
jgi:integrase